MPAAKILVTLVIIFIGLKMVSIIYNSVKGKVKEGFDNQNSCPKGCSRGKGLDENCSDRVITDGSMGGYFRKCHYHCPGPYDNEYDVNQECSSNAECKGCGTYDIPTDPNGYALHPQNAAGLAAANDAPRYKQFGNNQQRSYSGSYTAPNNLGVPVNGNEIRDPEEIRTLNGNNKSEKDGDKTISKLWKTYTTGIDTAKAQLANADDQAINNKQHPLYENASHVHMSTVPQTYTNTRTTNMLAHNPTKNNMDRKEGYAFSGATMSDDSYYTDLTTAAEECNNSVLCAGINFDITSGQYSLMSMESTLKPRRGYVAYIKKPSKYGGISPHYGGRHHKDIRSIPGGAGGDPITWTLVASITPSFGYSKNNTLPNGSLSSKASSYAVPDEIEREKYDHHTRDKHHARPRRRKDYYNDNREGPRRRDERYEAPDTARDNKGENKQSAAPDPNTRSLMSGKPPETPYTKFAPTNKPRSPYLEPRPYNSLMDLFR